ncbi:MAG: NUDIX domain-containing protein, partial [Polyangiaceae bacterium]|nr:NUDIX domain-containing protein [Polyangiaceae bacterium]
MRKVRSCGVLVVRAAPRPSFLLLKHARRFDLPKGHQNPGESDLQCALRELCEETGIERDEIDLDPTFRYQETYYPAYARLGGEIVEKTLVIFLGQLLRDKEIVRTEHAGHVWVDWCPPHRIQKHTVDPLLAELEKLHAEGVRHFLIDAPGKVVAEVAAATRGRELLLFNVSAPDDALRQAQCQAHLYHTIPNHGMQADALAQFLVAKKWRNVLLLQGPRDEDRLIGAAFENSARRFGLKIVDKKDFVLSNDPRQRDLGNVGLLTAGGDYDVVFVADSDGEFARSVPYDTVRPRPVVGAEGLGAEA